jgi:AraC-like DNA-binding protein
MFHGCCDLSASFGQSALQAAGRARASTRRSLGLCRPPLRRHYRRPALWDAGRVTLEDLGWLRRARDVMDRDYADPLDVPALARAALMSPGHFSRSFRAAFGETPYSYLMTRRIERAKALLRRGDLAVTEVCFAVGCTSLGSFSSRFTELVGESPSSYRARGHDESAAIPACVAKVYTRPVRNREAKPAPRP